MEIRSIIFKIDADSPNLKPLVYFIKNNFKSVKYLPNTTLILNEEDESVKKRYLLKWAHKVSSNTVKQINNTTLSELIESLYLPIQVVVVNNSSITQMVTITLDHVSSSELSITFNQYYSQVLQYFKSLFKDSITDTSKMLTLNIKIKTKNDIGLLKKLLSSKKISNILVKFVTNGLNFQRLEPEDNLDEIAYKEKIKKSYKVLSITINSTKKEIKNNYKKMLRKYHPDRVYCENDEIVALYTRRFQVIQEAYALIKQHHK